MCRFSVLCTLAACALLTLAATTAHAQNRYISGTTDANGEYVPSGTYNGKTLYKRTTNDRWIVGCNAGGSLGGGIQCGSTGSWSITNDAPPLSQLQQILYFYSDPAASSTAPSGSYTKSAWGASPGATVSDTPPAPPAPTLTSPDNGATGVASPVTLTWSHPNAGSGEITFLYQVATEVAFSNIYSQNTVPFFTQKQVILQPGTTYYWRVRATLNGVNSEWSAVRSFTTRSVGPPAPTLTAPAAGATNVSVTPTLSWTASPGATSYDVMVITDVGLVTVVNRNGITETLTQVTGLTPLRTYHWQVRAVNADGASSWVQSTFTTRVGPFVVNSTGDGSDASTADNVCQTATAGECTLRAAIQQANATTGASEIHFAIGTGPVTISPTSQLPLISDPVTIDGTTQPGFSTTTYAPIVRLDGASAGATAVGLILQAGSSTLRGLMITRFAAGGIYNPAGDGNTFAGNYIGTDGTNALGNGSGIDVTTANNVIGGTTPADRNVVGGNTQQQILLQLPGASGNVISGNYVGVNAAGTAPVNAAWGGDGILIQFAASGNTIGGTAAGARNVIGGTSTGIVLRHQSVQNTTVQGNYIGLDVSGTMPIRNGTGVEMAASSNNTIGGTTPGAGNVISGNTGFGLRIHSSATGNVVQGNRIGTSAGGAVAVPNATGINVASSSGNTIGGTATGAGNIISGNTTHGITLTAAQNNTIQGNTIGLNATGSAPLPNNQDGISISASSSDNVIGGSAAGRNVISGNGRTGVSVGSGINNSIRSNLIYGNAGTEIDLGPIGTTANDANDSDTGANNLQNAPEITAVTVGGAHTITYRVPSSTANAAYPLTIEFYRAREDGGFAHIGTETYSSGNAGSTVSTVIFPFVPMTGKEAIIATATDANGNTSEFSPPFNNPLTFVVNHDGDTADPDIGDGVCGSGGQCTLRAAIQEANETAITDNIHFAIGTGAATISPSIALPAITAPIVIDGTTQPGFSTTTYAPIVRLDGASTGGMLPPGLRIDAGSSTVRGLMITRFSGAAISTNTQGGNSIIGNYLGTDGTSMLGNRHGLIVFSGGNNTIGGTSAADRNVFSANAQTGITLGGPDNVVQGNYIGLNAAGTAPLGNLGDGVSVAASNNTIGGTAPGTGNVIAGNGGIGVRISSGTGNRIRGNRVYGHTGLGIDLGGIGVHDNDDGDGDTGPNDFQNFPVLTRAGKNLLAGTLDAASGQPFTLDFYVNDAAHASGHGEGQTHLGSLDVTTDATGHATFSFPVTLRALVRGEFVTATATDASGNTSEFSLARAVVVAPVLLAPADGATVQDRPVALTWEAIPGESAFDVEVATDAAFTALVARGTGVSGTSFAPAGLLHGQTYHWRVRVSGSPDNADARTFTTSFVPVLASPGDAATLLRPPLTLVWRPVPGAVAYDVQVATDAGFTTGLVTAGPQADTTHTLQDLIPGQTYYWRARVSGAANPFAAARAFTAFPPPPGCPVPLTPATGSTVNTRTPLLTWTSVAEAHAYHVEMGTDPTLIAVSTQVYPEVPRFMPTLAAGRTYYWRVFAVGQGGLSGCRNIYSFTIPTDLATPVLRDPAGGAAGVARTARLVWTAVPGAEVYDVQVATDTAFARIVASAEAVPDTSFTTGELAYGTTYLWRARARRADGWGAYAAAQPFTTLIAPPGPVILLTPAPGALGVAVPPRFTWTGAERAQRYDLQVSAAADFASVLVDQRGLTETTYQAAALTGGGPTFFWQVRAVNATGAGPWVQGQFVRASATAVEDEAAPTALELRPAVPNPFEGALHVRYGLPAATHVRLALYDALGRQVAMLVDGPMPAGRHTAALAGAALPSGVYVMRLTAGPHTRSQRVVRAR